MNIKIDAKPMLNIYPDSIGANLDVAAQVMALNKMKHVFGSLYLLPSVFNTDLDRGFSVIDYNLNEVLASKGAMESLKQQGLDFKFDLIMNHASVLSPQFQDMLKRGQASPYKDFFIDWNQFWEGQGSMTNEGHIQPNEALIRDMYFRKPGLPILNVRMPDGEEKPYWNTFYQEVRYEALDVVDIVMALGLQYNVAEIVAQVIEDGLAKGLRPADLDFGPWEKYGDFLRHMMESRRKYLGQMDLNIESPLVWEFYEDTLEKLRTYGASVVRLDAFAYAHKEVGQRNFFNEPGTWDILGRLNDIASSKGLSLLPEIHSKYHEKIHEKISEQGYMTYDFFLPGLLIDALERGNNEALLRWIDDIVTKNIKTVNMLGCHDGIPLLDLKGLLDDQQIQSLIDTVVARGGFVKDLHGKKNIYYQVNATYYSALGENSSKLLLARAIQMFMPGKPQIWYLDLFAGKNDHEAVARAGAGGHKEINRTNLSLDDVLTCLEEDVVLKQLDLIRLRNEHPAFGFEASLRVDAPAPHLINLTWTNNGATITLKANLQEVTYEIIG